MGKNKNISNFFHWFVYSCFEYCQWRFRTKYICIYERG